MTGGGGNSAGDVSGGRERHSGAQTEVHSIWSSSDSLRYGHMDLGFKTTLSLGSNAGRTVHDLAAVSHAASHGRDLGGTRAGIDADLEAGT